MEKNKTYKLDDKELDLICDCHFMIMYMKVLKEKGDITEITYNTFKRILSDYLNMKKRCL